MKMYMFPYKKVSQDTKVVIWGLGLVGKTYIEQILCCDYCKIIGVVDNNPKCKVYKGLMVENAKDAIDIMRSSDYIVVAIADEKDNKLVTEQIIKMGISSSKIVSDVKMLNLEEEGQKKKASLKNIVTYAQHGEDLIAWVLLRMLGIERPSYIDLGAHHPYEISNTALLYENGSRGVNVEANPDLIQEFER